MVVYLLTTRKRILPHLTTFKEAYRDFERSQLTIAISGDRTLHPHQQSSLVRWLYRSAAFLVGCVATSKRTINLIGYPTQTQLDIPANLPTGGNAIAPLPHVLLQNFRVQ